MAISGSGIYRESIGGAERALLLRNGEIERFEVQYAPFGFYELFDQLMGRGPPPQVRHVRDIVALALVGGGLSDRAADDVLAALGPEHDMALRATAQRVVGLTLVPKDLGKQKKKEAGSRRTASPARPTTTPPPASETSAA